MYNVNEQKIVEMYSKRRSLTKIRQETGYTVDKIKSFLKEEKLWTGHSHRQFYLDEFFFDVIDTEEKAYWLGFIYADGYLALPQTIGIELKDTDHTHLEKFRASLDAETEVKFYNKKSTFGPQRNCRFAFSSKHMFNILLSYFKSHKKTFEGVFPKLQREELIPHLIRGFFDGDGSLIGKPNSEDKMFRPSLSLTGRKETLEHIETISGFSWNWSQRFPERNTDNYQIAVGRVHDCLNFLHYMYNDATIYLDRKYELYQGLIENRSRNCAKARV